MSKTKINNRKTWICDLTEKEKFTCISVLRMFKR